MNKIINPHLGTGVGVVPSAGKLFAALNELRHFGSSDLPCLASVLREAGMPNLHVFIQDLNGLHFAPDATLADVHAFLVDAHDALRAALEALRAIHGSDAYSASVTTADWDAKVAYIGARVEEIVRALDCALRMERRAVCGTWSR